jgi:hypothetical protein
MTTSPRLSNAHIPERSVKYVALEQRLDEHRAALTTQCRWVLGSGSEAEGVRAAFVAALVHLPARQRSVLLLRDVLQWRSSEVADLLGITVPSVNSALQRARANVRGQDRGTARPDALDDDKRAQLHGYVQALESLDVAALTGLLRSKEGPAT